MTPRFELCECTPALPWITRESQHHDRRTHERGDGACTALDSYGFRCACPGFVPVEDEEGDHHE